MCVQGFLDNGRHAHACVANPAWTQVMPQKEVLVQDVAERIVAMDISVHEIVGFVLHMAGRSGLRCDEERGGSTLVAGE